MKSIIITLGLALMNLAGARDAGTITLTPLSTSYDTVLSGIAKAGDPELWTIDLSGFSGAVSLTITLADWYPGYPDDYDVSLNGVFMGNTMSPVGKTFQATVSPISNPLKIAYVNAHTGIAPEGNGSGYNLRIVASLAVADPLKTDIAMYAGINITGTVGASYRVEYTFDLLTWIKLADIVLPSSPYIYFDLVPVNTTRRRFYRVVAVP